MSEWGGRYFPCEVILMLFVLLLCNWKNPENELMHHPHSMPVTNVALFHWVEGMGLHQNWYSVKQNSLLFRRSAKRLLKLCYVQMPKHLLCSTFIDLSVLLRKWAISHLRKAASALNFTASCSTKSMFKEKISTCLKSAYVAGNRKVVKKNESKELSQAETQRGHLLVDCWQTGVCKVINPSVS